LKPTGPSHTRWVLVATLGLGILLFTTLVLTVSSSGAPLDPYNTGDEGTSRLIDGRQTEAVSSFDRLESPSKTGTAIIVGGTRRLTTADIAAVSSLLDRGGTVVVITEEPATNELLAQLGAETRLGSSQLLLPETDQPGPRSQFTLTARTADHPIDGAQVNIAVPVGTTQSAAGTNRTILAWASEPVGRDRNSDGQVGPNEPVGQYPVAVRESVGAGQLTVVGDASLLLNGLWKIDGNRAFATAITDGPTTVVYPQTGTFPRVTQLRFALRTTVGTSVAVGLVFVGAVVGGRLAVWLHRW